MKETKNIIFVRHGESFDDIYNEFGAWTDRELTPNGVLKAFEIAQELDRHHEFDIIFTSPLKRASQTAEIIGEERSVRVEEDQYLIERNTYGLLAGVNRELAIQEYPALNAAYLEGKYIHGAERYPAFQLRINALMNRLMDSKYNNIVCVTHGFVITEVIEQFTQKVRNSVGHGSMIEFMFSRDSANNITGEIVWKKDLTFTDDPDVIKGLEIRKFVR